MSIILKGIDLPEKENRMYMMELYSDGHCSVAKIEDGECYELTIPSETKAIQIPKDHGRLIDGDELLQRIVSLPSFRTNFEGVPWAVLKDVEVLPEVRHSKAILEAEE